jgi:glycine cleavage system H protein
MKFTETHEWIELNGKIAKIGITDYAQKELGEIVYAELPHLKAILHAGDQAVVLESTKAAVDIYTPISGKVVEVNSLLLNEPQTINHSPEKDGWLFKMTIETSEEIESLMDRDAYLRFLSEPS